ncbi:high-affinity nitrate transporter 3.2-like isoform X1 [Camellia sinensis]|uniref:Uncharacterized protein n=1 Tax=Camellia sinensis var. sinensis TaxID=542762 RepID=A0A4S4DAS1_CAMSN|nr:high-affinity nitrate transporter 3.2-like isoform X1 [Camellia sinensis]THF99652.1 hypothetical protein TEA_025181 [Camellia sinensis var. sinensis]
METCFLTTFVIILLFCLAETCYGGGVMFSSLPQTLVVSASPQQGQGNCSTLLYTAEKTHKHEESSVLNAGEDTITLTWGLNQSFTADMADQLYKNVIVKLCYAPISQVDRAWRKTVDNLSKDKTCQFTIVNKPYQRNQSSDQWMVEKDVPTATYFVRAYAYNSAGEEMAYGQTTDDGKKSSNLFEIRGITGRHLSLHVASACFSAFSLASLFGLFWMERRKVSVKK